MGGRARLARSIAVLLVLTSSGCALTSKSTPIDIRYFALEAVPTSNTAERAPAPESVAPVLALGHVTSSAFLRNPIVYRRSAHEVGSYDDRRWTEYPETFLRRSLENALFEQGRFVEGLGSRIPTIDVELMAFEEVVRGADRSGRVQIGYRLRDDRTVIAAGVLTIEREVADAREFGAVVEAIGAALHETTRALARIVGRSLGGAKGVGHLRSSAVAPIHANLHANAEKPFM